MPDLRLSDRDAALRSPFSGALGTPAFAEPEARMLQHVGSKDELAAFLDDAGAVIEAIRDYVWSLGEETGP